MKNNREKLLENFDTHLNVQNVSVNTYKMYFLYVEKFLDSLDGLGKDLKDVVIDDVAIFLAGLNRKNNTSSSSLLARAAIKRFLLINKIFLPWDALKLPKKKSRVEPLINREELFKIMEFLYPCEAGATLMCAATGMRYSEMASLRYEDIDWSKGMVYIRKHKDSLPLKTGGGQVVLLGDLLAELKKSWIYDNKDTKGLVFVFGEGKNKKRLTDNRFWKQLQKAVNKAGILKSVHPHTFRAYYITRVDELSNHNAKVTKDAARHKDYRTTMIYTRDNDEGIKKFNEEQLRRAEELS